MGHKEEKKMKSLLKMLRRADRKLKKAERKLAKADRKLERANGGNMTRLVEMLKQAGLQVEVGDCRDTGDGWWVKATNPREKIAKGKGGHSIEFAFDMKQRTETVHLVRDVLEVTDTKTIWGHG